MKNYSSAALALSECSVRFNLPDCSTLIPNFNLVRDVILLFATGSVDLDSIRDPITRHMYEIQILEFGQIPRQLFNRSHPPRFGGLIPPALTNNTEASATPADEKSVKEEERWCRSDLSTLNLEAVLVGHKKSVTGVALIGSQTQDNGHQRLVSVSLDGLLKVFKYLFISIIDGIARWL